MLTFSKTCRCDFCWNYWYHCGVFCGFACKLTLRQQTCHELSFNKKTNSGATQWMLTKVPDSQKSPRRFPYSELSLCDSTASANFCPTWAKNLSSWATQRGLHNILYSYIPRFVGIIITHYRNHYFTTSYFSVWNWSFYYTIGIIIHITVFHHHI